MLTAISFICLICSEPEWYRMQHVRPLLNNTIQTECFADGMRAQGVDEKWIRALQTAEDRIPIRFYYEDTRTVGFTRPDKETTIYLNRKFHDTFSYCRTASNVAHEVLHLKGFRHFADAAYAVNAAFEPCCFE